MRRYPRNSPREPDREPERDEREKDGGELPEKDGIPFDESGVPGVPWAHLLRMSQVKRKLAEVLVPSLRRDGAGAVPMPDPGWG